MQRINTLVRQIAPLSASTCSAEVPEDVKRELAPTGTLRVALNMRNELLISKSGSGEPEGVAPSLATAFAEKLGVPVQFVPYDSPADLSKDAEHDKWDIAMIGSDPARAAFVDFTKPYCQIEATYAVPTTSGAQKCADVDKDGTKIAGCAGAAYVLWLEKNLKNAKLETVEGHDATYEYFKDEGCQAIAGLRPKLKKDASKRPGTRILKDKFMAVEQAACAKKGREKGFKLLSEFIDDSKKSGMVAEILKKFKKEKDLTIPM